MEDSPGEYARSDSNEEIMLATYCALREHGYADLTIKRIAEEYGKSTAAVHYYYETKDDLLVAFLDYLLDQFIDTVHEVETVDPQQRLDLLLDKLLTDPADHRNLLVALLEMQSQAPYKITFREQLQQNDEYLRYLLRTVISHGIEEGVFSDVDAEHAAQSLMTIVHGARTRAVVLDDPNALVTARRTADDYVDAVLQTNPE
ncbi:MAG: TetR family transcriptional regulator C-terminal domain-containing protein [Euryarchaeota archaeon]|nr:TetR family transcriptional regulator C-terminal domain-containing protein [Euryarchaeota archaeon]